MTPRPALLALPLVALAACGGDTARTLGFTRDAPDEFLVQTRAPLSVPPRLGDLPVPTPGAPRPQEVRNTAAILAPGATATRQSAGELALVSRSSAGAAPDDIRRRVDEESLRLDRPPQGTVNRVLNFLNEPPPPGIPVDPAREAQRLRENAALGRDVGEGDTPIVQPRSRTFLQRLLGT
jgi:hypothetical protein